MLALIALGFAGTANAQKIAVIDTKAVLTALPEAQAANTRLEAAQKSWADSLQMMKSQYEAKVDAYSKVGDLSNADQKKKRDEDLQNMAQAYSQFQNQKFGQQGEYAMMQAQLIQPIMDKVKKALDAYGHKEKYMAIIDKNAAIYSDASIDVTTKFQEFLKTYSAK